MTWLSKLWTWCKARWKWIAAVAVALAGGIVMAASWPRKPKTSAPPAAPVGLSPKQAEEAREQAEATHAAKVGEADQDLESALQGIAEARERKKKQGGRAGLGMVSILLGLSLLGLAACRTSRPAALPPVPDAELARLCGQCQAACEAIPGDEGCACAEDCAWAKHAAAVSRADLRRLQAVSGADAAEAARVVQEAQEATRQAEVERDDAKAQRWDYFGWGVGAGAVVAAIVVGAVLGR